jgi:hypothetical protein
MFLAGDKKAFFFLVDIAISEMVRNLVRICGLIVAFCQMTEDERDDDDKRHDFLLA